MTKVVTLKAVETDQFELFWAKQRHKTGKLISRIKWDAITGDGLDTKILDSSTGEYHEIKGLKATPEEIIEGYDKYLSSYMNGRPVYQMTDEERQYLKRPIQFLNQGMWMDG